MEPPTHDEPNQEMYNLGLKIGRQDRNKGLVSIGIALPPGDYRNGYIEGYGRIEAEFP